MPVSLPRISKLNFVQLLNCSPSLPFTSDKVIPSSVSANEKHVLYTVSGEKVDKSYIFAKEMNEKLLSQLFNCSSHNDEEDKLD